MQEQHDQSQVAGVQAAAGDDVGAELLVGADHRRLIIVTPLLGAVFLVSADLLSRTVVPPQELPLGAITAAVGVPVFVFLMKRRDASMVQI